jgi:formylglycine-generating enzyme required for sulfatase activity
MGLSWYIRRNGAELGPFHPSQISEMAREKKLLPEDAVRRSDRTDWTFARRIKGLIFGGDGAACIDLEVASTKQRELEKVAKTHDGRSVILFSDGTWKPLSSDGHEQAEVPFEIVENGSFGFGSSVSLESIQGDLLASGTETKIEFVPSDSEAVNDSSLVINHQSVTTKESDPSLVNFQEEMVPRIQLESTPQFRRVANRAGAIKIRCPNGHVLVVDKAAQGKRTKCPMCAERFLVKEVLNWSSRYRSFSESDQKPKSGQVVSNKYGVRMRLIPAGTFLMGSTDVETMAEENEKPQHPVEISQPFYLGVFPVTQDEYERVTKLNPSQGEINARCPVNSVSWYDAVAFCNTLSISEHRDPYYDVHGEQVAILGGKGYRLPTEAEWEYACRADTLTNWSFGNLEASLKEFAWFVENSEGTMQLVGKRRPNPWGLYDMHGNVWEWCWDWNSKTFYWKSPVKDPLGSNIEEVRRPGQIKYRVLRGGSYQSRPHQTRSTYRGNYSFQPECRDFSVGFRIARTQ